MDEDNSDGILESWKGKGMDGLEMFGGCQDGVGSDSDTLYMRLELSVCPRGVMVSSRCLESQVCVCLTRWRSVMDAIL